MIVMMTMMMGEERRGEERLSLLGVYVVHLVNHEGSLLYSCMVPYNNIIRHMKSIVGGRGRRLDEIWKGEIGAK